MIIVETILGALTGYFTNDLAIRHLFRKNGVVVKERAQFTDMIVDVLKKQILSPDLLDELCQAPQMRSFFSSLVRDELLVEVPQLLSDASLADLDEENALHELAVRQLNRVDLSGLTLRPEALAQAIEEVLAGDAFVSAWNQAGENLRHMTLYEAGLHDWFLPYYERFHGMDKAHWQAFLQEAAEAVCTDLDRRWELTSIDKDACISDYLPWNGQEIVTGLESLIFSQDGRQSLKRWLDLLQDQEIQARFYNLGQRLLPEAIGMLLEPAVEIFFPLLHDEKRWIEAALADSITLGGRETGGRHQTALSALQAYFAADKDGRDWMEQFYDRLQDHVYAHQFCDRISRMFLDEILSQIDLWRSALNEEDEAVAQAAARYEKVRTLLVDWIDAFLARPLHGSQKVHSWMQRFIRLAFDYLGHSMSASQCMDLLRAKIEPLCLTSLDRLGLTAEMWQALGKRVQVWWQSEGLDLLSKLLNLINDEDSLRSLLISAIDRVFETPMGCLLVKGGKNLPLDDIADRIRQAVFAALPDYLARITHQRLDEMSHEEIRQLVLGMIGKEMRPLSWLGGAVGMAAGFATGAAMTAGGVEASPEDMQNIAQVVAGRSAMYGVVGWTTNVMAIKGLFWPYKKVLCFQGLISANQERFADSMSHLANEYVLNDAIWRQQVVHIRALYEEHHEAWLARALHELDTRREVLLQPHYQGLLKVAMTQSLQGLANADGLRRMAAAFSSSNKDLAAALFRAGDYGLARRGWQLALNALQAQEEQGRLSHALGGKLQRVTDRQVFDLLMQGAGAVRFPAHDAAYSRLLDRLSGREAEITAFLLRHHESISGIVENGLLRRMSFALVMGYRLMGGHELLDQAMVYFLENHLPLLLQDRSEDLRLALLAFTKQTLQGKTAADIGILPSMDEAVWLADLLHACGQDRLHGLTAFLLAKAAALPQETLSASFTVMEADALQILYALADILRCQMDASWKDRLNWEGLAGRLQPLIEAGSQGLAGAILPDEIFAGGSVALWQAVSDYLTFSDQDKALLIRHLHALISMLEGAVMDEAIKRGRILIGLLDLPQLTKERIMSLSPQMLEQLIRGIAHPYFTRVEAMGALGAVVALPATYISMAMS
jgi:uncharacterized membrane protein YheB (UPF0754 family)